MEIEKLLTDAETAGVAISLTADGKVRVDGTAAAVREIAKRVKPMRAAVIEYLKQVPQPNAPTPAPGGDAQASESIEVEQDESPGFAVCPRCGEPLLALSPEIQVANVERWQRTNSSYYWWAESQLARLREHLSANPDDVVILPGFAHSLNVRRPDGSVYTWFRVK
ncbi:MAG TPA: hypothetical protein VMV27_14400 [Candidatus Binataceae bacterium]|nr:hypothetical protein [Candidatus Binataceae bacterium]